MQHRLIVCALSLLTVLAAGLAHADLKVGLVQQQAANGTPNYTQNFEDADAGFSDDVKAVVFFGTKNSTNDSAAADLNFNIGFAADDGSELAYGIRGLDNQATSLSSDRVHFDHAYIFADGGAASSGEFTVTDWIQNGVQVTWEDQSQQELITAVMFGGDIDAAVIEGDFLNSAAPETLTLTHGLSCTPEVIMAVMSQATTQPGNSSVPARLSIGWWTTGGTYSTGIYLAGGGAAAAVTSQALITDGIAGLMTSPTGTAVSHKITIANVDADSFDAVASAQTNSLIGFLAMCSTGPNPIVAKVGQITGNTSPGTAAEITGMSVQPKVFFGIPTVNTTGASDTDAGGVQGLIAAVDDPSGSGTTCGDTSTKCGGGVTSVDDGSDPTDINQQATNSCAIRPLTIAGAVDGCAQIESWDSGGITFDYTDAFSDAYLIPYIAMGMDSAVAPAFSSGPTVSAQDDNDYTLSYTPDASATFYVVACVKDSTAPTVSQVKAGDCTGDVDAIAATSEAVTGADTTVLTIGGTPRPIHDLYAVLSNGGGDSSLATLADEALDAPTGYQYVTLASVSATSWCDDFNDVATPDIAAGDILKITTTTSPGAFTWTQNTDCNGSYTGDESRQSVTYDIYDTSVGAYMAGGPGTLWFNDPGPSCSEPLDQLLHLDEAMTEIDLDSLCSHPSGDALSSALTSGSYADLSLNGTTNVISGTPTVEDEDGVALTYTVTSTTSGSTATQDITIYPIDTIAVPDCDGLDVGACVSSLEASWLDSDVAFECNTDIASSDVISQDPAATTEVEPESTVDLIVSRGACIQRTRRIGIHIGIH